MTANPLREITSGGTAIFRAIRFLFQHPRLSLYCLAPIALGVITAFVCIGLVIFPLWHVIMPDIPFAEYHWYQQLAIGLAVILGLALATILTIAFINLIAGPFHEQLSQRVADLAHQRVTNTTFSWPEFMADSKRAIRQELATFALFGGAQLLVFAFNLIPGIGSVLYLALNVPLLGFLMAYEYLDLPLSRDKLTVREKIHYLRQQPLLWLTFGWTCALALFIPILNLFLIPICVIAGTLLYCDHEAASRA